MMKKILGVNFCKKILGVNVITSKTVSDKIFVSRMNMVPIDLNISFKL